jgi:hypothetical protein
MMDRIRASLWLNELLVRCPTSADRRDLIRAARAHGAIDDNEVALLLEADAEAA